MRENTAKTKLIAGQIAIGALETLGSPLAAQLLSLAGFDFVAADNQHGAWDAQDSMAAFHEICLGPAIPMARVRQNDFYAIGRLLDRSALGIIVPMVNCRADAEAAALAMRYPPRGGRSVGAFGVAQYGSDDYAAWANDQVYLAVQIETERAVNKAEEILSVEGVDGCWIGPGDLSYSLGTDLRTPEGYRRHEEAIMSVLAACGRTGKVPGIAAGADSARWLAKGFRFVTVVPSSIILRQGAEAILDELAGFRGRP